MCEAISHAEFEYRLYLVFSLSVGGSYELRLKQMQCDITNSQNIVEKIDIYSTKKVINVKY